jgi:hypothetical protein
MCWLLPSTYLGIGVLIWIKLMSMEELLGTLLSIQASSLFDRRFQIIRILVYPIS